MAQAADRHDPGRSPGPHDFDIQGIASIFPDPCELRLAIDCAVRPALEAAGATHNSSRIGWINAQGGFGVVDARSGRQIIDRAKGVMLLG